MLVLSSLYWPLHPQPQWEKITFGVEFVSDTRVCVADPLKDEGQEIYHVLGGADWKTVLKVKKSTKTRRK